MLCRTKTGFEGAVFLTVYELYTDWPPTQVERKSIVEMSVWQEAKMMSKKKIRLAIFNN